MPTAHHEHQMNIYTCLGFCVCNMTRILQVVSEFWAGQEVATDARLNSISHVPYSAIWDNSPSTHSGTWFWPSFLYSDWLIHWVVDLVLCALIGRSLCASLPLWVIWISPGYFLQQYLYDQNILYIVYHSLNLPSFGTRFLSSFIIIKISPIIHQPGHDVISHRCSLVRRNRQ